MALPLVHALSRCSWRYVGLNGDGTELSHGSGNGVCCVSSAKSADHLAQVAAPPAPLPSKRAAVVIGLRDGSAGPEIDDSARGSKGDLVRSYGVPWGRKMTLTSLTKPQDEKQGDRF